jgi:hypothetical protein
VSVPGTTFDGLTGVIDDSAGSGVVIPLGQVDDEGVEWRITDLSGWDSADLQEQAESKTGADGAFDALNYFGARIVQVKGMIVAPDAAALEAARYRLTEAVPPRRLAVLRFNETTPKYVMARRSGRLMVGDLTDNTADFDASMLAPDPRKYGVDPMSASLSIAQPAAGLAPPWTPPILLPARSGGTDTATVTNAGNYETQPLIRIAGPGQQMQIVNLTTGATLLYDLTLGAQDYLLIDCHAGVALLNGTAPRSPAPGSSVTERFVLVPGVNRLQLLGTATDAVVTASASVTFQSAWD